MATYAITKECSYCWGTGKNPAFVPEQEEQGGCPKCSGTGRVEVEQVEDIADKLNDILDKCNDIFDLVNS